MSDLLIRAAHPYELDAVGDLTLRAYEADGYFSNGVAQGYKAHLANAQSRATEAELLVAVDPDGTLLGTVTIALPGTPYAEVSHDGELEFRMLAVDPNARKRGVASALIQAVLDRARELRFPKIVLCSQESKVGVQKIYQKLGFRRLPERDWNPLPDVRLIAFELEL